MPAGIDPTSPNASQQVIQVLSSAISTIASRRGQVPVSVAKRTREGGSSNGSPAVKRRAAEPPRQRVSSAAPQAGPPPMRRGSSAAPQAGPPPMRRGSSATPSRRPSAMNSPAMHSQ